MPARLVVKVHPRGAILVWAHHRESENDRAEFEIAFEHGVELGVVSDVVIEGVRFRSPRLVR